MDNINDIENVLLGFGYGHINMDSYSYDDQSFAIDIVDELQYDHYCKYSGDKLNLYNSGANYYLKQDIYGNDIKRGSVFADELEQNYETIIKDSIK